MEGGREAAREGGREGGRQGGREAGRQGGSEGGRQGIREAGREGYVPGPNEKLPSSSEAHPTTKMQEERTSSDLQSSSCGRGCRKAVGQVMPGNRARVHVHGRVHVRWCGRGRFARVWAWAWAWAWVWVWART